MDCNREEAIRAKTIAETKMQSKDFSGAQKFALKAQKLHPEVENISQILIVCEVHCSAAKRLSGGDLDWYGILQIEKTADEASIKKQYRRFALQLHPDKNKFAGAEGAFKLVGEAQRTLLDKDKRRIHDAKHSGGGSRVHVGHANANRGGFHYPVHTRPVANPVPTDPGSVFWTACPFCLNKFQYLRDVMHRSLRCQTCSKPFIALDIYSGPSPAVNFTKPVFPTAPPANGSFRVEVRAQPGFRAAGPSSRPDPVHNPSVDRTTPSDPAKASRARREKKRVRKRSKDSDSEPSANESVTDSEDSVDSDEDTDADGDAKAKQSLRDQSVRRSSRSKQKVSYKENLSDNDGDNDNDDNDDDNNDDYEENGRVSKKAKGKLSEEEEEESKSPVKDEPKESFDDDVVDPDPDQDPDQDPDPDSLFSYPDPDFSDFEKGRAKERFAAGQVWAAYDDQGAMPRFYVKIKRVDRSAPSGFRVTITWLEPDPGTEAENRWVSAKLPFSCGSFGLGNTENTENLPMFSHLMPWSKGPKRNSFVIYPRKGETWALFKNWDLKWSSDPDKVLGRDFDYEFVEILSDFDPGVGIHVALLSKVEGFVSLFARTETLGKKTILVPPGGLSRFSHMVSSEKMRGNEGERVPRGSFELDPASLPMTLLAGSKPKPKPEPETGRENGSTRPSPENFEIPEPEFHNFDSSKTEGGFRVGDVWALYSDEDGLPKYYCRVERVVTGSAAGFELKVSWLAGQPESGKSISWADPKMPVCCGRFRPRKNSIQSYDSTSSFSHQVRADPVGNNNNEYLVLPRKGEIWALYSDWRADMSLSDLGTCEYEIVEILSSNDYQISAIVLDRVDEFNSVFMAKIVDGSSKLIVKKCISRAEIVRFSHQIPAFRLTDERGGQLRGFWELDPAALPVHFFSLKSKESKN